MNFRQKVGRGLAGLGIVALMASALPQAAVADDKVTQEISTGGELSAYVEEVALDSVEYSNVEQSSLGELTLIVDDPRGSSEGWNVTISASDFIYEGTSTSGDNIPATGFTFSANGTVSMTAGQEIDATGGPSSGAISGMSLATPQKVIRADAGSGSGTYTEILPVALVIPAQSQTGTYTSTLTVSILSGP